MARCGLRWGVFLAAGIVALASGRADAQTARADLRDAQGQSVGTVTFTQGQEGVHVSVRAAKLPPGYHGFHVHAVGKCEGPAFTSAGGHFNPAGRNHPEHAGDLPALLVNADGSGWMTFHTVRFKLNDLFDADGSALIIHGAPDNYAHIPDRYRPAPDSGTLGTGDAGARIACGVITR